MAADHSSGWEAPSSARSPAETEARKPVGSSTTAVTRAVRDAPAGPRPRSATPAPSSGRGTPTTGSAGARARPMPAQVPPVSRRPRSSAPARRESTATRTGREPCRPTYRPSASGRWMTGETAGAGRWPASAAPTCRASRISAGARSVRARSVPTLSAAWSAWDVAHVVRRASANTAAATAAVTRTIAVAACARRAACWVASGSTRPRERPARAAPRPSRAGTRRTPSTVSTARQSTGAAVRTTSPVRLDVDGCPRSCHQARAAAASRRRSRPWRARPARVGGSATGRGRSVAVTSVAVSRTAVPSTASTSAHVMTGPCWSPAAVRSPRWVRRAWRRDAAGTAIPEATSARSAASAAAVPSCWRRPSPIATSRSCSSSRTDPTSRPVRSAAARESAVPRSRTTRTVDAVLARWAWRCASARGSRRQPGEPGPVADPRRQQPRCVVEQAPGLLQRGVAGEGEGGVGGDPERVDRGPLPTNACSSTTNGP